MHHCSESKFYSYVIKTELNTIIREESSDANRRKRDVAARVGNEMLPFKSLVPPNPNAEWKDGCRPVAEEVLTNIASKHLLQWSNLPTWCMKAHVSPLLVLFVNVHTSESCHHHSTDAHGYGDGEYDDGRAAVLRNGMVHHTQPHQRCQETKNGEENCKIHGNAPQ